MQIEQPAAFNAALLRAIAPWLEGGGGGGGEGAAGGAKAAGGGGGAQ